MSSGGVFKIPKLASSASKVAAVATTKIKEFGIDPSDLSSVSSKPATTSASSHPSNQIGSVEKRLTSSSKSIVSASQKSSQQVKQEKQERLDTTAAVVAKRKKNFWEPDSDTEYDRLNKAKKVSDDDNVDLNNDELNY